MTAKVWDKVATEVNFNLEIDLAQLRKLVPLQTPILDYGCGYGRVCNHLQNSGFTNITGCDSSKGMIKRGNTDFPYLHLFQNSDIRLQHHDNSFGAIILCAVLTCIIVKDEKTTILREINRLLKPDGVLHVVEFCNPTEKIFESGLGVMMHYQTPDELRQTLNAFTKEVSFKVEKVATMSGKSVEAISYFGSISYD